MQPLFFPCGAGRRPAAGDGRPGAGSALQQHAGLSPAASLRLLDSRTDGLAFEDVLRRLVQHGPNRLRIPAKAPCALARMARTLSGRRVRVVRRLATYGLTDSPAQTVPVSVLVPGDIIHLAAGDIVPADVRLLDPRGLRLARALPPVWPAGSAMGDRVLAGSAGALVLATGRQTLLGQCLLAPPPAPARVTLARRWRQTGAPPARPWSRPAGVWGSGVAVAVLTLGAPRPLQAAEVTLYGTVDAGVAATRVSGAGVASGPLSGGQTDTHWGLHGRAALGGDTELSMRLEGRVNLTDGSGEPAESGFGTQSWLGLSHPAWGALRVGRQYTVGQAFMSSIEIAGWKDFGMGALLRAADDYQVPDALSWLSPAVAGWQAGLSYSPDVGERGFGAGRVHVWSGALQYASADWQLVASYETLGRVAESGQPGWRPSAWQLGASAELGGLRVAAGWSRQRNGFVGRNGAAGPASVAEMGLAGLGPAAFLAGGRLDAIYAGVAVPLGEDALLWQWSQARPNWRWQDGQRAGRVQVMSLGYVHAWSARTSLYGFAAMGQRYDMETAVGAVAPRVQRVAVGMTHHF